MSKLTHTIGIPLLIGWSIISTALGIYGFESQTMPLWMNYLLILQGAGLIALLPANFSLARLPQRWTAIAISLLGFLTICCAGATLSIVASQPQPSPFPLVAIWFAGIALLLLAAFACDRLRRIWIPRIPRKDVWIGAALFTVALAFRAYGPDSIVGDEYLHTKMLRLAPTNNLPQGILGSLGTDGYPHLILYLQWYLNQATASVFDVLTLQRWISCCSGALSIVFWFGFVRQFSSRLIASASAGLLVFFGWHWLNSRFMYAYPPDMAIVTLSILTFVLALRHKSFFFASVTGLGLAASFLFQKSGLLLLPLIGYLALEELFASTKSGRKPLIVVAAVTTLAFMVSYEPYIILFCKGELTMPLQKLALQERAEVLPKLGLNQFTALGYMFMDAFRQFQVSMNDNSRHMLRPLAPILDPIFSLLFSIGLIHCVASARRSVVSRLCIVGLLVFILPMAFSFPFNDHLHGLARRMLNTSFFLAWISALGAVVLAQRVVSQRNVGRFVIGCCSISALTNIWFTLTTYQQAGMDWYQPAGRGIQSMAILRLIEQATTRQIPCLVLEEANRSILPEPSDPAIQSGQLKLLKTTADLKKALLEKPGTVQMVILPWDTMLGPRDSIAITQELADVIPPYLWIVGEQDPEGMPMLRYAFVRGK